MKELRYGNWIRKRILVILGSSAVGMGVLALLPVYAPIRILAGVLAIVLLISFLYPLYAYYMFSPRGGNLQDRFYDLIIESLGQCLRGRVLDIGTGNGILAIKIAQKHPEAQVVAMDYWGKDWEYSKSICEENASFAQVSHRIDFVKGDAASLQFADASFDAVVSNLTFHEVKSVKQKRDLVREALRVLKPDGIFAFVDYFYDSRYYGPTVGLETFLQSLGLSRTNLESSTNAMIIPKLLQHPKILGRVGILYGQK